MYRKPKSSHMVYFDIKHHNLNLIDDMMEKYSESMKLTWKPATKPRWRIFYQNQTHTINRPLIVRGNWNAIWVVHQSSRERATGTVMPAGSALLQPSIHCMYSSTLLSIKVYTSKLISRWSLASVPTTSQVQYLTLKL